MHFRRRYPVIGLALVGVCVGALVTTGSSADARLSWNIAPALSLHRTATPPAPTPPAPTPTPTPTAASPPAADGFSLQHTYTFDGSTLDPDWAVYDTGYTNTPDARVASLVTVSDGALHVTTSGAKGSGLCLCRGEGKPTTPYGRWDIRARAGVSADHGFAMLLWPNAENWPVGGEIDIAEFPGLTRSVLQTTVHYGATNQIHTAFTPGTYTDWHTYSVIWTASSLTYLVDDRQVMTVTDPAQIPTGAMHLALQAGTNRGVNAAGASTSATTLDVAWVKVYR